MVASNPGGSCKSNAAAEVDEKPEIVKGLVPAELDEGDEQVFRVEVSAPVREVKVSICVLLKINFPFLVVP